MKKFRLIAFLIVLGILLVNTSYGQKNFNTGYLITLKGDTLNGYIAIRDKEQNPKAVKFKIEVEGQEISYTPKQIKKIRVQNEAYESAVVTVDDAPIKDSELTYSKEVHPRVDITFLRTLVEGEKSLFYYKDEKKREYFFIRQSSGIERLEYKKYLVNADGRKKIKIEKPFIGQLATYFQSCPSVQSRLSEIQYNTKDLINIFQDYYKCTDSKVEFQQKREKITTEYGVVAGVSSTKLNFYSSEYDYLTEVDFARSTKPTAGLFINFVFPKNQGKWSIYNEFLFSSYKFNGEHHKVSSSSSEITTDTKTAFEYSYIKLNSMLRFKFPVQNMFYYWNAGMANGFAIKEINTMEKVSRVYSKESVVNSQAFEYSTKLEQGFLQGLGSQFKKYSIEARYEVGNGMSGIVGLGSVTSRFHVLLGYRF